jgi:hypothetical protein
MTNPTKCEGKRTPGRGAQDAKRRQWEVAATIEVTRDMIQANVIKRACNGCEDSAIALLAMW